MCPKCHREYIEHLCAVAGDDDLWFYECIKDKIQNIFEEFLQKRQEMENARMQRLEKFVAALKAEIQRICKKQTVSTKYFSAIIVGNRL